MPPIVLTGTDTVEGFVVNAAQQFPAINVFPNPFGKLLLDEFLPVLGNGGFLFVEDRLFLAVLVLNIVKYPHILLIQGLLQDVVGAHPLGAVGGVGLYIAAVGVFLPDTPLAGGFRAQDSDTVPHIVIGGEQLHHELLVHLDGHPVRTNAHADFTSAQVLGLNRLQSLHISAGGFFLMVGGYFQEGFCHPQLLAHFPGKVLIRCDKRIAAQIGQRRQDVLRVLRAANIPVNHPGKFLFQFLWGFPRQLRHIVHIHTGFFRDGHRQRFTGRVHAGDSHMGTDGALGEHIGFSF